MKIRRIALGFVAAACLFGQHHRFSWQEACFKNFALPYCQGHDFAARHARPPRDRSTESGPPLTRDDFVVEGIDWRFADPEADWIGGFNFSDLPASPLARKLMTRAGLTQGFSEADVQKTIDSLSRVQRLVASVHNDRVVMMVTRKTPISTAPAVEPGWKAALVGGNAMLIGNAGLVEEALRRMDQTAPLGELAVAAVQRQGNSDFWAVGWGKLAGKQAVSAGAKEFAVAATIQDHLTSDAYFEFEREPSASSTTTWPSTWGKAMIDGNSLHTRVILEGNEVQQRLADIASSLLGERLGAVMALAKYLPGRDTTMTGQGKAVIYGLDQ